MLAIDLGTNSTFSQRHAIEALRLFVDQRLGYPKAPSNPDKANPWVGWTLTCTRVALHPTDSTRFALLVSAEMATGIAAVLTACRNKVTAGTATAIESAVAALPDPGALDNSWQVVLT